MAYLRDSAGSQVVDSSGNPILVDDGGLIDDEGRYDAGRLRRRFDAGTLRRRFDVGRPINHYGSKTLERRYDAGRLRG